MNPERVKAVERGAHSPSLVPKTPFLAEIAPGRQLVEFTVSLENTPGAIEAVAAILRKHNVNVLSGFHDTETLELLR